MGIEKLNPLLWDIKNRLYQPIQKKLLLIANDFLSGIELPIDIKNIYLTGSICSYNWTSDSDLDLHIIALPSERLCGDKTIQDYFDTKSKVYNKEHEIYIKGYRVEVNIKYKEELLKGKAIFDLQKDEWISKPVHSNVTLNDEEVIEKTKKIQRIIDNAIENNASMESLKKIRDEIKNLRKTGLESNGEFSIGNLTFKRLRHTGYIKKLYDYKAKIRDAKLSLESFSSFIYNKKTTL